MVVFIIMEDRIIGIKQVIMKIHLKQILLLLLLLSCVLGEAQDRLGFCPLKNAKELFDDYDERLEKILHYNLSEDFLARCVFIPSFEPEWALQIERDTESKSFQICTLTFEKNLWYQKEDTVGVSKRTMLIEDVEAFGLINLVNVFIQNKSEFLTMGCVEDGEMIEFEALVAGVIQCGATVCPDENSYLGRLVAIIEMMKLSVDHDTLSQEVFALSKNLFDEVSTYYSDNNNK